MVHGNQEIEYLDLAELCDVTPIDGRLRSARPGDAGLTYAWRQIARFSMAGEVLMPLGYARWGWCRDPSSCFVLGLIPRLCFHSVSQHEETYPFMRRAPHRRRESAPINKLLMNKQDLVDASRDHLRLSIACTLKIPWEDYQGSLDTRTGVNRCLTHVMSLGYNDNFSDALKEALGYRFLSSPPSSEEFDGLVTELRAIRNTFRKEVGAYRYLHKKFSEGEPPSMILEQVESMTPLAEKYFEARQAAKVRPNNVSGQ